MRCQGGTCSFQQTITYQMTAAPFFDFGKTSNVQRRNATVAVTPNSSGHARSIGAPTSISIGYIASRVRVNRGGGSWDYSLKVVSPPAVQLSDPCRRGPC
jgi:hypothetical protein